MSRTEPDMRGLGLLALLPAALSIILAFSLIPFAFVASAVGMALGVVARKDARSRPMGTVAVVLAAAGFVCATAVVAMLA
ncbi:MAG TPA: hypothetical protein VNS81_11225 [Nocardioides sp.]|nr:hypothetical protein [Nocardioides sp.]